GTVGHERRDAVGFIGHELQRTDPQEDNRDGNPQRGNADPLRSRSGDHIEYATDTGGHWKVSFGTVLQGFDAASNSSSAAPALALMASRLWLHLGRDANEMGSERSRAMFERLKDLAERINDKLDGLKASDCSGSVERDGRRRIKRSRSAGHSFIS